MVESSINALKEHLERPLKVDFFVVRLICKCCFWLAFMSGPV